MKINQEVTVMHPWCRARRSSTRPMHSYRLRGSASVASSSYSPREKGERLICLSETDGVAAPLTYSPNWSGFQPPA